MAFDIFFILYKYCGFFQQWLLSTIILFFLIFSLIISILTFSIDGFIDIKGIDVNTNGFKEWKTIYLSQIVINIVLLIVLGITLITSIIAGHYLKLKEFINTKIGFIPSLFLIAVIFVISLIGGILSVSLYSTGKTKNTFVEEWNVDSIRYVESHYECCFGIKGKGARAFCVCDLELNLVTSDKFKNVTYDISQIVGSNNTYVRTGNYEECGECEERFYSKNTTKISLIFSFDFTVVVCSVVLFGVYLYLFITTYLSHDRD